MKAILCESFGPPSSLAVREVPDPEPAAGEVVVEIAAAGLNFFDTLIIEGKYQYRPDPPFSPGAEFAGTVAALGAGVSGFAPGDRVVGHSGWNACREKVAVSAARLVHLPDEVDFKTAAGLTVTYATALYALSERGELKSGETLVVLGAAGGIGIAAVEIGKLLGAWVIAVASSPEKLAFCRERGADDGIDYAREDLRARLKELCPGGADVICDPVGGPYAEAALRGMGWKGRFLVVGFAAGEIPRIPLNLVLLKGCDIRGVFWGRFIDDEPERHADCMSRLLAWIADRRISVPIHASYALADTGKALIEIAERRVQGKVVVLPGM